MDKPVLIIQAPELNDESVVGIYIFLQELIMAFESHYFQQLREHHQEASFKDIDDLF